VYNSPNTSYPLMDGLGSVRGMVNAMSDVLSTTTYSPYGVPDSPISGFAFTGEQRDTNGLQYHRARYYNTGLGTWASLDPFEGIHNHLMSLNGYAWVEGNVVNGVDPSGLCATDDEGFAQCIEDANFLTSFGFYPLWEGSALERIPEGTCQEVETTLRIQPNQKLKWTANEMRALREAVRILFFANQKIEGFKERYKVPLQNPVKIVKRDTLPSTSTVPIAGTAYTSDRIIALSADVWSGLNNQTQSWLMIHEFGHILISDLGFDPFEQGVLATNLRDKFSALWVSQYSYSGGIIEHLIEAITGTIWNAGYSSISGYDSSAGGRTGFDTLDVHLNSPIGSFRQTPQDDPNQEFQFIINVRLNTSVEGGKLGSETASNTLDNQ
jgi:RHS repeat-associated protein